MPSRGIVSKRLPGLDLLKAILMIMIVARHTGLIQIVPKPGTEMSGSLTVLLQTLYMSLQNLAVPTFMVISLWLFAVKRREDRDYFKKRIGRLVEILVFWWGIYALATLSLPNYPGFSKSAMGIALLPLIDGAMYFLGSLVIQVVVIELITRLIEKMEGSHEQIVLVGALVLGLIATLIGVKYVMPLPGIPGRLAGLGPLIFCAFGPAVLVLTRMPKAKALIILLTTTIGATALFWIWTVGTQLMVQLPYTMFLKLAYPYPPTMFLAILIMLACMKIRRPNSRIINTIATWGLGIYLVHPLVMAALSNYRYIKTVSISRPGGGNRL